MLKPGIRDCQMFDVHPAGPPLFFELRPAARVPPRPGRRARPVEAVVETRRSAPALAAVPAAWSMEPLAVAILVTLLPPVGVTLLWASPRFTVLAKAVLTTLVTGFALLAWATLV